MNPFELSRFVWIDQEPQRNALAIFRRMFQLQALPADAILHLFADTRYRLTINGKFVSAGPGRFVTQFPEYDSIYLHEHLRLGNNLLQVEVNFFGASSFQSMPDGMPGFIAAGTVGEIDLGTPGHWVGEATTAWRGDAPLFSFAQSPVEICDTRQLSRHETITLRELGGTDAPWGELAPFSGTPLPFTRCLPTGIALAGPINSTEQRVGFMAHDPTANRPEAIEGHKKPSIAFATWIYSEVEQIQVWSCFWSQLSLNGSPLKGNYTSELGNHGTVGLALNAGWNFLTGVVDVLTEYWAYCLGIPLGTGVSLHASRDLNDEMKVAVGPVAPKESVLPLDTDAIPTDWLRLSGDPMLLTPARMMGWDVPAKGTRRELAFDLLNEVNTFVAEAATWCFTFPAEFLGHIVLEVDAPAGSILDVACDDWMNDAGAAALYKSNPFIDSADRFILQGGSQQVELFHPRGGKLVQVTLRAPAGEAVPLTLNDIWVRSRQIFALELPQFESDHETLNWAWSASLRTLAASTDDAYSDCPWRERGSYIGDSLVNLHLTFLLTSDYRTARRTFLDFARAQRTDGQLAGCAPAWLRVPHEDFTLIWILAARDYWAHTGDVEFLREVWGTIERIWDSPTWESHESGLWNLVNRRAFIDWGVLRSEREGEGNAAINALRVGAATASAEIADILGESAWVERLEQDASATKDALLKLLWDAEEGRLFPGIGQTTEGLHANVWALAFGIGSLEERLQILTYLQPLLMKNVEAGLEKGQFEGHLELYFLSYLLPTVADMGRPDLAEHLIQTHYGYLQSLGDDTLPECFCRVEAKVGSRCHSWSGAAAIYAARYVLGIRFAEDGDPDSFIFDPMVSEITRASGSIPHSKGEISVKWELVDGEMKSDISAPEGITVYRG